MRELAPTKCKGLSPRVRGNPLALGLGLLEPRSIPASAGEPPSSALGACARRVYPRECGGTALPDGRAAASTGLSPRVRGNPAPPARRWRGGRSIPASAGEPPLVTSAGSFMWVYPRECGGTLGAKRYEHGDCGLSPRVRGNPAAAGRRRLAPGSIPASAGEPAMGRSAATAGWVYPRECGGTFLMSPRALRNCGLSPRVRGNHGRRGRRGPGEGSIPASAGEPSRRRTWWRGTRVYPRECGGTVTTLDSSCSRPGLSPRVRGNRRRVRGGVGEEGSIPASAGEPRPQGPRPGVRWVYPRECGGTPPLASVDASTTGLSPRVRGNRGGERRDQVFVGSIPASAGEPLEAQGRRRQDRVYPRECGGTNCVRTYSTPRQGLSPRVRGNRRRRFLRRNGERSIPASAGEPVPS